MAKYLNPFHSSDYQGSTPVIENDEQPVEHAGYLIYHRVEVHRKFTETIRSVFTADVYDIVRPGKLFTAAKCVGMCAGLDGAKRRIETNQPPLRS